jgi:hypothetical protein
LFDVAHTHLAIYSNGAPGQSVCRPTHAQPNALTFLAVACAYHGTAYIVIASCQDRETILNHPHVR